MYQLEELFLMQQQLDETIHLQHNRHYSNTFHERILALLVELGELANETRCFKYWSIKEASPSNVIMEEYSDGIHFLLSLGIHLKIPFDYLFTPQIIDQALTKTFIGLFAQITEFASRPTNTKYFELVNNYLGLGVLLNIDSRALKSAYIQKNQVNFERQKNNY